MPQLLILIITLAIFFGTIGMRLQNPLIVTSPKEVDKLIGIQSNYKHNDLDLPEHSYGDRLSAAWHIIRGKGICLRIKK